MKKSAQKSFVFVFAVLLCFSFVSANGFTDFFGKLFGQDIGYSPYTDVYVDDYCAQVGGYNVFDQEFQDHLGYGVSEDELKTCFAPFDDGDWDANGDGVISWSEIPTISGIDCRHYVCGLDRGIKEGVLSESTVGKRCAQELDWSVSGLACDTISPPPATASCGDGVINSGEECDGLNFGGEKCTTLGHDGGYLVCGVPGSANECIIDDSKCVDAVDPYCGDGVCNGAENWESCNADCDDPGVCGDAILVTGRGEQCDDGNIQNGDGCSATCQIEEVKGECSVDADCPQTYLGSYCGVANPGMRGEIYQIDRCDVNNVCVYDRTYRRYSACPYCVEDTEEKEAYCDQPDIVDQYCNIGTTAFYVKGVEISDDLSLSIEGSCGTCVNNQYGQPVCPEDLESTIPNSQIEDTTITYQGEYDTGASNPSSGTSSGSSSPTQRRGGLTISSEEDRHSFAACVAIKIVTFGFGDC